MKRKIFSILFALVLAISLTLVPSTPAMANDVASSTMHFEGNLTDAGGGVYTGTIAMTAGEYYVSGGQGESISTGGGFDVYAKYGGTAYVQGLGSWVIGSDHDAYSQTGPWGSWYDPDCADWYQYSLELTADHWYLRYTPTGESPMSGVMYWHGDGTGYAAETDPGTVRDTHGGSNTDPSEYASGSAQEWGWHCGWGEERIPLEFPGFEVVVTSGSYAVTMMPAPGPVTNLNTGVTYGTIQAAVDAAQPGDTIIVTAGTYNEQVVIGKSLTLQAASSPVIDGGGMLGPGVHITAADVTFQGFTVTNFTCTPSSGVGGIWVEGDRAIINDNTIYNIVTTGDPINNPAGIGIDVAATDVEVTGNLVHDVGSIGIRVRSRYMEAYPGDVEMSGVLVEDNTVYNTRNTGVLVAGYITDVTIKGNEIYNSLPPTPYSLWIFAYPDLAHAPSYVTVEGNTISGGYGNVHLWGANNITITGNTISGAIPHYTNSAIKGKNIYIRGGSSEIEITNNNITGADGYGVNIKGNAVVSTIPSTTITFPVTPTTEC